MPTTKEEYEQATQKKEEWSQSIVEFAADLWQSADPTLKNVGVWIASEEIIDKIKAREIRIPVRSPLSLSPSDQTSRTVNTVIPTSYLLLPDPGADTSQETDSNQEHCGVDTDVRSNLALNVKFQEALKSGKPFRLGIKADEGWRSLVGPEEPWAHNTDRLGMHAKVSRELTSNERYMNVTASGKPFDIGIKTGRHWKPLFRVTREKAHSSDDSDDSYASYASES